MKEMEMGSFPCRWLHSFFRWWNPLSLFWWDLLSFEGSENLCCAAKVSLLGKRSLEERHSFWGSLTLYSYGYDILSDSSLLDTLFHLHDDGERLNLFICLLFITLGLFSNSLSTPIFSFFAFLAFLLNTRKYNGI